MDGNQIVNLMLASVMSGLAMRSLSSLDVFFGLVIKGFTKLWDKLSDWWTGSLCTVKLEHYHYRRNAPVIIEKYNVNNKILIEAVMHGSDKGRVFSAENTLQGRRYETERDQEEARRILFSKCEQFEEDEIFICKSTEMTTITQIDSSQAPGGGLASDAPSQEKVPLKDVLTLRSTKGVKHIAAFLERKKRAYIELSCSSDRGLMVFGPEDYGTNTIEFAVTPFETTKSFDNWFFPGKTRLLHLLDHFENKSGPFAVPGAQHKLVILLHGEPGCGKTSFVKALAKRLNRHLFPLSLDKVKSWSSFRNFFYREDTHDRRRGWRHVPFEKRLIVLEEIDTAGGLVLDRQKLREAEKRQDGNVFKRFSFMNDVSRKTSNQKAKAVKSQLLVQKKHLQLQMDAAKERQELEQKLQTQVDEQKITRPYMKEQLNLFDKKIAVELDCITAESGEKSCEKSNKNTTENDEEEDAFDKVMKPTNGLTLGDLLNVFDGIQELKGFVCVMTTNHRDYLDPALVRPGRVTIDLELTKMKTPEIEEMLTYHYVKHDTHIPEDDDVPMQVKQQMIIEVAKRWDGKVVPSLWETLCMSHPLSKLQRALEDCCSFNC